MHVHFFENNTLVLSQLLKSIPSVDGDIKIKGRKGKVVSVKQINDHIIHVQIWFEPVIKQKLSLLDTKKKKR